MGPFSRQALHWRFANYSSFIIVCVVTACSLGVTGMIYNRVFQNLTSIPDDITPNTTHLILTCNQIDSESGLPILADLQLLNLDDNKLPEFQDLANVSTSLRNLHLDQNLISTLEPSRLNALIRLNLRHNLLTSFPDIMGPSGTLERIFLTGNQLVSLPDLPLLGSRPLITLYIKDNFIATMSEQAAKALPNLEFLNLGNNLITGFPPVIGRAKSLKDLNLGNNQIDSVPRDVFSALDKLEILTINQNLLTTPPNMCHPGTDTIELKINQNPLICNCAIQSVLIAVASGKADVHLATCNEPPNLSLHSAWRNYSVQVCSANMWDVDQ